MTPAARFCPLGHLRPEWRSLRRRIAHAPKLEWPRGTAFQAMPRGILHETESPTVTDLPSVESHQTKRLAHRLVFRQHY
jgi:hypothetical protein